MTSTSADQPAAIRFAAVGLDHSHIYDQISGLLGQGCELVGIASDDVRTRRSPRRSDAGGRTRRRVADPRPLLRDRPDRPDRHGGRPRPAGLIAEAFRHGKDVVARQARLRHASTSSSRSRAQ